jgi:hypothetical protein
MARTPTHRLGAKQAEGGCRALDRPLLLLFLLLVLDWSSSSL